jgi:predicted proteasome-type protease
MTTIVGVQLEHGCIIVSDSRIAAGGKVYTHSDMVKAVERGSYLSVVLVTIVLYKWYSMGGRLH